MILHTKHVWSRHSCNLKWINTKPSGLKEASASTKKIGISISVFLGQVNFVGLPLQGNRKKSNVIHSERTGGSMLSTSRSYNIWTLPMTRMQFWPTDLTLGSFRQWGQRVIFLQLLIEKIERWAWSQCATTFETHRAACSMTYFRHYLTQPGIDLESNFYLHLLGSSRRASTRKHDGVWIIRLSLFLQTLLPKSRFSENRPLSSSWLWILKLLKLCLLLPDLRFVK